MLNQSWQIVENLMSAMSHCEIDAWLPECFAVVQPLLIAAFFCGAMISLIFLRINSVMRPKGSLNNLCKDANDFLVAIRF